MSTPRTPSDAAEVHAAPGPDRAYADRLQAGHFTLQRCLPCMHAFFYPRVLCPKCGGTDLEWMTPSGRGVVYSTTTVRRKVEQGGDYNVSIVELEEGPRLMTRVEGMAPHEVQIGMPVSARVSLEGDQPLLVFRAGSGDEKP